MAQPACKEVVDETDPEPFTRRLITLAPSVDLYGEWHVVRPQRGESARWERIPSEWVAVELGAGEKSDRVIVRDGRGQRQEVDSFEAALRLARCWCR